MSTGLAAAIGAVCLGEEAYREAAILHARTEREKMTAFLKEMGCTVIDSEANFLSFKPGNASKLYKEMLQKGIVLRHSENFRGMDGRWLRIGMKSNGRNGRVTQGASRRAHKSVDRAHNPSGRS